MPAPDPEILEVPSSLLVPINTQAVFVCKVHCISDCTLQWFVGNSSTSNQHQKHYYETRGFSFSSYRDDDLYTLRLAVNATLSNNDTVLRCHALLNSRGATSITSDAAILQIMLGMYVPTCNCGSYNIQLLYLTKIYSQ
jgi:hypothetical protein